MDTTNPGPTSSTTTGPVKAVVDYRLLVERATGRPLATARLNPRPGPQYRHGPETGPLAEWTTVAGRCVLVVTDPEMARHVINEIRAIECDDCGAPTDRHRLDRCDPAKPALRCDECSAARHAAELADYGPDSTVTCSHCGGTWAAGEVAERGWCGSTNLGPECHSATFDGFDIDDLAAALDTHTITAAVEAGVGVERPY